MALTAKSLLLFDFQIDQDNSSLDFVAINLGPTLQATLRFGSYSLSGLMREIKRAMESADPAHTYTVQADRTFVSGTENRVSITTNGTFLTLLFGTGPRVTTSVHTLIGFATANRTGAITYQGTFTAGNSIIPDYVGYNYLGPEMIRNVFGALTITASGEKEAIVWAVQQFLQVEFKYEPEARVLTDWRDFFTWAIQQKSFEFTPSVNNPSLFYEVTMETTSADGKAFGYKIEEMLPEFPFFYRTGMMKMRVKIL